mmetsp:Transcript_60772/g.143585  ORF Transcript_60772/g.143585 Transcript_60772/m.143585 type:complete len:206 (+) Transcript_60772:142-759(+)
MGPRCGEDFLLHLVSGETTTGTVSGDLLVNGEQAYPDIHHSSHTLHDTTPHHTTPHHFRETKLCVPSCGLNTIVFLVVVWLLLSCVCRCVFVIVVLCVAAMCLSSSCVPCHRVCFIVCLFSLFVVVLSLRVCSSRVCCRRHVYVTIVFSLSSCVCRRHVVPCVCPSSSHIPCRCVCFRRMFVLTVFIVRCRVVFHIQRSQPRDVC